MFYVQHTMYILYSKSMFGVVTVDGVRSAVSDGYAATSQYGH